MLCRKTASFAVEKPNSISLFDLIITVDSTSRFHMKYPSRMSIMTKSSVVAVPRPIRNRVSSFSRSRSESFFLRHRHHPLSYPLHDHDLLFCQRKVRQKSLVHDPPGPPPETSFLVDRKFSWYRFVPADPAFSVRSWIANEFSALQKP